MFGLGKVQQTNQLVELTPTPDIDSERF